LPQLEFSALLVLGKPEEPVQEQKGLLHVVNHLPDSELAAALKSARLVVCRSGYSTLMDLHSLEVQALLVPTPGQSEQEYLARHHAHQGTHQRVDQHKLILTTLQAMLKQ
jgi:UDP-N-acetylglucosamine:LPS N-acetylglucosamine transferase